MSAHPPGYRTLASLSRINLLFQLQQRGTMTVGDLADATGLHPNTAREHLDRLIGDGFVTCEPEHKDTKGRPRMLYSAAAGADHRVGSIREAKVQAALHRADQLRRLFPITDVTHSEPGTPAACGAALQRQLDALEDHLDQSGFDSVMADDGLRVHLHDCPYSAMVSAHPEVCGVHFRLIQGVLDQADGPIRAEALHILEGPNTCTVDLERTDTETVADARPGTEIIIHGVLKL